MHCVVIGAGLLGLSTAWFLRQHGNEVTVLERGDGAGLETSFANGGMLHASQPSPWNEPGVVWQALRTLGQEDSPLLIRPGAVPRMLPWVWSFFRNSARERFLANSARNAVLADYSLTVLNEHLSTLAIDYDRADVGTLKIFRTAQELEHAGRSAERCREWNIRFEILRPAEVTALEPALAGIADGLSGGIHFPDDISGDAHRFCTGLAAALSDAGVAIEYGVEVRGIDVSGERLRSVRCAERELAADALVLAAGAHSRGLLAGTGISLPVQPVKGYSITVPTTNWDTRPRVPVIDEHYHAAVCPLGERLRVAGTAEFAGFDAEVRESRINNLFELVRLVYPRGAAQTERSAAQKWTGFRPMSPDGVGIMGRTPIDGLFLNTGHGHLGWTMAPAAGKLVADQISGLDPEISLDDYSLDRF